jgi:hypothetical protein
MSAMLRSLRFEAIRKIPTQSVYLPISLALQLPARNQYSTNQQSEPKAEPKDTQASKSAQPTPQKRVATPENYYYTRKTVPSQPTSPVSAKPKETETPISRQAQERVISRPSQERVNASESFDKKRNFQPSFQNREQLQKSTRPQPQPSHSQSSSSSGQQQRQPQQQQPLNDQQLNHNNQQPAVASAPVIPPKPKQPSKQVFLKGFTNYVSREDLLLVLGPFQPKVIEPLYDNYLPTGKYLLTFENHEIAKQFVEHLNTNHKEKFTAVQEDVQLPKKFDLGSHLHLDSKTVLVHVGRFFVNLEILYYWTEDFAVAQDGIKYTRDSSRMFLIRFETEWEAKRFVATRLNSRINDRPVRMHHYQA